MLKCFHQGVDLSAGQPWLLHIHSTQSEVELLVCLCINNMPVETRQGNTCQQSPASPSITRRITSVTSNSGSNPPVRLLCRGIYAALYAVCIVFGS